MRGVGNLRREFVLGHPRRFFFLVLSDFYRTCRLGWYNRNMAEKIRERRVVVRGAEAMRRLGDTLARRLNKEEMKGRCALIVGLFGDLGSGKTTFTQGFAKGLGAHGRVQSPTFVLLRTHQINKNLSFQRFVHIDAYRMETADELLALGWEQLAGGPENIILIEWAERIKTLLPHMYIRVTFRHKGEKEREVVIKTQGAGIRTPFGCAHGKQTKHKTRNIKIFNFQCVSN